MVDEVFQDDDAARRLAGARGGEQAIEAGKDGPLHGGEGTAMEVEACHLLQDLLVGHEDWDVRAVASARCCLDERVQGREPTPRHEEGAWAVTCADGSFDDVRGFGHVQASFRFNLGTKLDVFEARVVVQARIRSQLRARELNNHDAPYACWSARETSPGQDGPSKMKAENASTRSAPAPIMRRASCGEEMPPVPMRIWSSLR